MPIYSVKCPNQECDLFNQTCDVMISFKQLTELKCVACETKMVQQITASDFIIYGCSSKNGWFPEKMNYDGSKPDW